MWVHVCVRVCACVCVCVCVCECVPSPPARVVMRRMRGSRLPFLLLKSSIFFALVRGGVDISNLDDERVRVIETMR